MRRHFSPSAAALPWTLALASFALMALVAAWKIPHGLGASGTDFYSLYAASLREGRLWLTEAKGVDDCPYDMSWYGGKCYMYWGIFPALVHLALPAISGRLVAIFAAAVAIFFLVRLIVEAVRKVGGEAATQSPSLVPLVLASLVATALLTDGVLGRVYEEAVVVGLATGLAGIASLLPCLAGVSIPTGPLVAGSACLAMAALTRTSWIFAIAAVVVFLFYRWVREGRPTERLRQLAVLVAITGAAGCFQAWLNWARFGNPLEFGIRFSSTLYGASPSHGNFSPWYIPRNLAVYFFVGFFTISRYHSAVLNLFSDATTYREFPIALFPLMPSLLIVAAFVPRLRRLDLAPLAGPVVALSGLAAPVLMMYSQVYRYGVEAWVAALVALVPLLLAAEARERKSYAAYHWASLLLTVAFTFVNSQRLAQQVWAGL